MVDPRNPSNPTAMLMQAQERKHLVNKLINLRSGVDKKEPRQYTHLSTGRINRRNNEVRKINAENQQMLKKIMNIMNRKPKSNGLENVPLKRNISMGDFEELDPDSYQTFRGNEDISLVQSNVEQALMHNRLSFEINPAQQNKVVNPFKTDQRRAEADEQLKEGVLETQPLNSPREQSDPKYESEAVLASSEPFRDSQYKQTQEKPAQEDGMAVNEPTDQDGTPKIASSASQDKVKKRVESSAMFDKVVPQTDSENRLSFHPADPTIEDQEQQAMQGINTYRDGPKENDTDALTFQDTRQHPHGSLTQRGGKKLYPGQITLNHNVRKKEVKRINRENMVMLKAIKEIKPCVERTHNQIKHHMKLEQYKRNMSKFRNVGRSQPRPSRRVEGAASDVLPEINRYGSNASEMHQFNTPGEPFRKNPAQRRTSQGNRGYLEPGRQFQIPGSQRSYYRNNLGVNFNSNTATSEYHGNVSTRQETRAEEKDTIPETTSFPTPGIVPTYHDQNSINSSIIETNRSTQRRPSYLQKLKKSPLLSSVSNQQNIPRSIVNRVITQKDQVEQETFRRYGIMPRASTTGVPDHLFTAPQQSISQGSVISNMSRRRNINDNPKTNSVSINAPIDVQIPQKKKMSPIRSKLGKKTTQPETMVTPYLGSFGVGHETEDGASLVSGATQEIQPISEENLSTNNKIQIDDQQTKAGAGAVVPKEVGESEPDPYSEYTPLSAEKSNAQNNMTGEQSDLQPPTLKEPDSNDARSATVVKDKKERSKEDLAQLNQNKNTENKASVQSLNQVGSAQEEILAESAIKTNSDLHGRNQTSFHSMSMPVTEGSKTSIKEDTAIKATREEPIEDEYQIPEKSSQEGDYSEEAFEEEQQDQNEASKMKTLQSLASDVIGVDAGIENPSGLERQATNEIEEEESFQNQQTGTFRQQTMISEHIVAHGESFKRQETNDIHENIFGIQKQSEASLVSLPEVEEPEEDVASTKTITQSKSVAQTQYNIQMKNSQMTGGESSDLTKPLVGKKQTDQHVISHGNIDKVSGVNTHGTGFQTENASGEVAQARIIQSKENIILSELSSKKNLE